MTATRRICRLFVLAATALVAATPHTRAQNRTQLDSPWHPFVAYKSTQTDAGKATFTNDCPLNQNMYVTIKKGFGPVDFSVGPNNAVTRSVDKGDKYAARCGLVVGQRASYDWVQLNRP
jgi:hypothetical protein